MEINRKKRIVFIFCLLTTFIPVLSQSPPTGLSGETWRRMNDRWEQYLSWVVVEMKNGDRLEGQVLYVTDRDLWLRPDRSIPMLPADPADHLSVPFREIRFITLTWGGIPIRG